MVRAQHARAWSVVLAVHLHLKKPVHSSSDKEAGPEPALPCKKVVRVHGGKYKRRDGSRRVITFAPSTHRPDVCPPRWLLKKPICYELTIQRSGSAVKNIPGRMLRDVSTERELGFDARCYTCFSNSSRFFRSSPSVCDLNEPFVSSNTRIVSLTALCNCAPRGQFINWQGVSPTGRLLIARVM